MATGRSFNLRDPIGIGHPQPLRGIRLAYVSVVLKFILNCFMLHFYLINSQLTMISSRLMLTGTK